MLTQIKMFRPVFRCSTDEDVFFERVADVAGLQNMEVNDTEILLSVLTELSEDALEDIEAICDMWHAKYTVDEEST